MRKFSSLPLRIHLLLLVWLLCLPTVVGIAYMGYRERRESLEASARETDRLAAVIASELRSSVAGARQLGTVLSQLPEVKRRDVSAVNRILADIIRIYPQYGNLIIADRDGMVWGAGILPEGPVSIADRRHFRNARASGQFSSGEFAIGRIIAKPLLNFAYPLRNGRGEFDGVIGLTFSLDFFRKVIEEVDPPRDTAYSLVDHRGVVIYTSQNSGKFTGRDDREDLFRRMHDGPDQDTFTSFGLDGSERLVSYRKLRLPWEHSPHLYVRASTLTSATLTKARRAQLYITTLSAPFFFAALFLALVISKHYFVDRIAALRLAVQRLAEGDLETGVADRVVGGELGELAQAFDAMARKLAVREKGRQDAVHELLESKKKYRAIFLGASDAIFVHPIDRDGRPGKFVEVNDRACVHLGYSKRELLRLGPEDVDDPRSREKIPEVTRTLLQKGRVTFEAAHVTADGRSVPVEVSARLLKVEDEILVYSIVHDITVRKQIESERREYELRYRRLAEANIIGIVVASEESILEANDYFLTMVGSSRDEFAREGLLWWDMTPTEWEEVDRHALRELMEHEVCTPFEKEYFRRDGSRVPALLGASLLSREPFTCICFILDLSGRRPGGRSGAGEGGPGGAPRGAGSST